VIGIVGGLALELISWSLSFGGERFFIIAAVVFLAATIFSIWGCTHYAVSKGLPDWFGYIGMFSVFGFVLIYLLPVRYRSDT